jgi:hypothetical protein
VTEKSKNPSEDAPRLILDLIGPFVVHFCEGIARIHAPLCVDHHANILTDTNDIPLFGLPAPAPVDGYPKGFIYNLTGPIAHVAKFNCLDSKFCSTPENLLILDKSLDPIDARECHLVLHAPRPDAMVPLLPEQIWIHQHSPGIWVNTLSKHPEIVDEDRARGLRFIYSTCPAKPAINALQFPEVACEELESIFKDLDAEALGFCPFQYHIVLRFASNSTSPDEHHEDAYNCFQEMRTLIPGASRWRADFSDSTDPVVLKREDIYLLNHGGSHPTDCGAAVLVVPPSD